MVSAVRFRNSALFPPKTSRRKGEDIFEEKPIHIASKEWFNHVSARFGQVLVIFFKLAKKI